MAWNIDYGGLGADADFILNGGKMGRPENLSVVERNLAGISSVLEGIQTDVMSLQEVDKKARRSYVIDQVEKYTALKPEYNACFVKNYQAFFISYPPHSPFGGVQSGLLTLSRFNAETSDRLQLPGEYSWPVRMFCPVRCAHLHRVPMENGDNDWCFMHIHLSAYDQGGTLRVQ